MPGYRGIAMSDSERTSGAFDIQSLLQGSDHVQARRQALMGSGAVKIGWRERTRLIVRLSALMLHLALGGTLALVTGMILMPHHRRYRALVQWWHRRLCRMLGVRMVVYGQSSVCSALWVSNHVSWLDIPVLGALFPVVFLSKAEVARWPVVGQLARAAGTVFIKRGSGDSRQVSNQLADLLRVGHNVLFFPEGTTTDGQALRRFFHRLFQAGLDASTFIQPVLICYRREGSLDPWVPFVGDDEFVPHARQLLMLDRVQVEVHVLPALAAQGRDARALAQQVEAGMRQELEKIVQASATRS